MREDASYLKLCETCAQFCMLVISKVAGSMQEVKCDICKKKKPCYIYRVTTKGDKNG